MTQTAVSFILGASLSAGWVGAFSKATDDLKGLSENLKRGSAALDAFSASREKMENASAALRRNREQIGGEEPTRAQEERSLELVRRCVTNLSPRELEELALPDFLELVARVNAGAPNFPSRSSAEDT